MKSFVAMPFSLERLPRWYRALGYGAPLVGVGLATAAMLLLTPLLSLGSIYLIYMVVVVAVAVGWGLWSGVAAATLAFLLANYFFVEPTLSFTVAAVQDVLALVIFLGLAILTSQLVVRLRQEAREARRSQRITATLYELSQAVNGQQDLAALLQNASDRLHSLLRLQGAAILLYDDTGVEIVRAMSGAAPINSGAEDLAVPLDAGEQTSGLLLLRYPAGREVSEDERRLLAAFAEQLQVAIERSRLQQATVEAELLRRTDALRVELLSTVAHDLRTPLASIKGAATGMLNPRINWTPDQQHEFLADIAGEVDHINAVVGNLLAMSRIEAGRLQPSKEPAAIHDVVDAAVSRVRARLGKRQLTLQVAPDLPLIELDPVEIGEALGNLLENALKYTPAGSPIAVSARREPDAVAIEVADRGPGIAADKLPHLFERFYRGTGGSGSGLGLSIVRAIVEAHGGQVSAANRPDGGMVFNFTLPITVSAAQEEHEAPALVVAGAPRRYEEQTQ